MQVRIEQAARGGRPVLGRIAFDVAPGQVVAVLGPSGIGKTTLLRLIAGLDTAAGARIDGAGRLGVVFQAPTLLPWRSVIDNITLAARCGRAEAAALLAAVGLGDRAEAYPGALSLGQQRRVALARAFAVGPDTLVLDEPFASLDEASAQRMQGLLADLLAARPTRAILVTHAAMDAARLADRVLRLGGVPAGIVADRLFEVSRADRDPGWLASASTALAADG